MTGKDGGTVLRIFHGSDPLNDPLVVAWDAVVLGDPSIPAGSDPEDTVLIQELHALESIPPPSEDFFADLERYFAQQTAPPIAQPKAPYSVDSLSGRSTGGSDARVGRGEPLSAPGRDRRFTLLAAAAVLAVLLIAGPLVFYLTRVTPADPSAIPAAVAVPPEMETLIELDFDSPVWDLPPVNTWEQIEFSMFLVDPGASFSTGIPWYTSVDGPLLIVPLDGDLIVQPTGSALVYRHGSNVPVESPTGEPVILGPNDAIAFSSRATATGNNPGSEPVRAIYGLAGIFDDAMAANRVDAHDVTRVDINYGEHLILPGDRASLSIQHLELAPLDTFVYELEPDWEVVPIYEPSQINELRVYDGAVDGISPGILADAHYASLDRLKRPNPGPHTLINVGDETVDLYFLFIEPYPAAATPSA